MESETHRRLKIVAMAFLKRHCVDLVATEVRFRNMRSRADVCGVNLKRREVRVVEVKASRADFLRDTKLRSLDTSYAPHCTYFYIMCPPGVVELDDVPPGVGLLHVDAANQVIIRRTPRRTIKSRTRFETTLRNTCRALTNYMLFNHHHAARVAPQFFKFADREVIDDD